MANQRTWVKKVNNELGITVAADGTRLINKQNPIYITHVHEDGHAYQEGRLEVGDFIFKVNGRSLCGITRDQAIDMLKQSGDVVELEVAKFDPTLKERRNKKSSSSEDQHSHEHIDYDEQPPSPIAMCPADTTDLMLNLILVFGLILMLILSHHLESRELHELDELLKVEVARVGAESI